jgi:carbon storage regulator
LTGASICKNLSVQSGENPCQRRIAAVGYLKLRAEFWASEDMEVLVLSRKIGERILIGDKIAVTVVKIGHGGVRIGVEAPPELAVVREELATELQRAERALAAGQSDSFQD